LLAKNGIFNENGMRDYIDWYTYDLKRDELSCCGFWGSWRRLIGWDGLLIGSGGLGKGCFT